MQRYMWRMRGHADVDKVTVETPRQSPNIAWRSLGFTLSYWSERGHEKEALLDALMAFLVPRKYLIAIDPGWNRWDIEIYRGVWSKARVAVAAENHGGPKRLLRVRTDIRITRVAQLAVGAFAATTALGLLFRVPEITSVGLALGLVNLGVIVTENLRLARIVADTFEIVAATVGLRSLGQGAGADSQAAPTAAAAA
jgi:hypothetical protein